MSAYFIASLKHTGKGHEHIVWWGRMECGYTPVLGDYAGHYCFGYAVDLNDGLSCLAVPVEAVRELMTPEPYYKPGRRFYDQRGPVVDNTKANWRRLIAASLQPGRVAIPKPVAFRGARVCVSSPADEEHSAAADRHERPRA